MAPTSPIDPAAAVTMLLAQMDALGITEAVFADYQAQVTVFLQEWRTIRAVDSARAKELLDARRAFEAVVERALADGLRSRLATVKGVTLTDLGAVKGAIVTFARNSRASGHAGPRAFAPNQYGGSGTSTRDGVPTSSIFTRGSCANSCMSGVQSKPPIVVSKVVPALPPAGNR